MGRGGDIHTANMTAAQGVAWCKNHAHVGAQPFPLPSAVPRRALVLANPNALLRHQCGGFTASAAYPAACASTDAVLELHFKDPW